MITVEQREFASISGRQLKWVVLDDGLVYDIYDLEEEARAESKELIKDGAICAVIEARIDELAAELWDRFLLPGPDARKKIKEQL
jgi:hypothetical protein